MGSNNEMMMKLLMQYEADVAADQEVDDFVDRSSSFWSVAQHCPSTRWFEGQEGSQQG
jgi:hypothetical protein